MAQQTQNNSQNQSEPTNINAKDFIIGTLIGGIVGATTALFLAPKSGKELRGNLNEQAVVLREKTGQLRETASQKGTEFANVAKEKASVAKEKTSQWSQQLQDSEFVNKVKTLRSVEADAEEIAVTEDSDGVGAEATEREEEKVQS